MVCNPNTRVMQLEEIINTNLHLIAVGAHLVQLIDRLPTLHKHLRIF